MEKMNKNKNSNQKNKVNKESIKKVLNKKVTKWPNSPKKWQPFIALVILALALAMVYPSYQSSLKFDDKDVSVSTLIKNYEEWTYKEVKIDWNKAYWIIADSSEIVNWLTREDREIAILPDNYSLKDLGLNNSENATEVVIKDNSSKKFWAEAIPTILMFVIFIFIAIIILNRMSWMAGNAMTFGKSRAKKDTGKDKVLFNDIAGSEEEKFELQEVVDFLKYPAKYKKMGAKIPRGILLVGPPGTGKTMLARAVAGESGVPFFSISGSEFVEMFVWVWASRVRDLFENAKKEAPAIIFIDEIDAIGKKRGPWMWGGHDEREQTLNQILTEMDGFENDTNLIVMWATNRADVLDKALLRPGRFDRKVTINLPTLEDRVKILEVHQRNKPIAEDIDNRALASSTVWFSGADLGALINESAILAARNNQTIISKENVQEALEKKVIGLTKKSQIRSEKENKITAYHEVGHALVWRMTENCHPVHKISIVWRGNTGWVTWFLPERDEIYVTKAKFLDEIASLFGWRLAEEIIFGKDNVTTWASNDIERATDMARSMVMRYWMDEELWAKNYAPKYASGNYLWAEGNDRVHSENTQELIDQRVSKVLKEQYERARQILVDNKEMLEKISEDLLKKEEMTREEFEAYFE